jgi:hypothetical protein
MRGIFAFAGAFCLAAGGCFLVGDYDYDEYGKYVPPPELGCDVEICDNDVDENCSPGKCVQTSPWAQRFGDTGTQRVQAVEFGPDGSVLVAGSFTGKIDLGSGLPSSATNDLGGALFEPYVVKLNADGMPLWIRAGGEKGQASSVAPIGSGEAVWTGVLKDNLTMINEAIVRRENNNGSNMPPHVWTKTFVGIDGDSIGKAVVVDGDQVYVAGTVEGKGTFPDACGTYTTPPSPKLFVAEFAAATGICQWAKWYDGGTHDTDTISMALDSDGDLVVAGGYGGAGFSGTALPMALVRGVFVLKVSGADGKILDSTGVVPQAGGKASAFGVAVAANRIFVTGEFTGAATIGTQNIQSSDKSFSDALVMALDEDLKFVWAERFGGMGSAQVGTSIRSNAMKDVMGNVMGDVFVTGITQGPMAVDPGSNEGKICDASRCMFLLKLDPLTGVPIWANAFGSGETFSEASPRVAERNDALVLAAGWSAALTFGELSLPQKTDLDLVVAKLSLAP